TSNNRERESQPSEPSSTHVLHLLRREHLRIPEPRILGNRSTIGAMDWYEPIFYACNYGVLLPWTLLIVAPRWRGTDWIVASALVPLLFGAGYAVVLFTDAAGSPEGSFGTLDGVVAIFSSRQTIAAGWIHYIVLDLFAGAWQARDARRLEIPHLAV